MNASADYDLCKPHSEKKVFIEKAQTPGNEE